MQVRKYYFSLNQNINLECSFSGFGDLPGGFDDEVDQLLRDELDDDVLLERYKLGENTTSEI